MQQGFETTEEHLCLQSPGLMSVVGLYKKICYIPIFWRIEGKRKDCSWAKSIWMGSISPRRLRMQSSFLAVVCSRYPAWSMYSVHFTRNVSISSRIVFSNNFTLYLLWTFSNLKTNARKNSIGAILIQSISTLIQVLHAPIFSNQQTQNLTLSD